MNTRCITLKISDWKDQTSCIWLRNQNQLAANWSKWNGICTGVSDFEKWINNGSPANIVCLIVKDDDIIENIFKQSRKVEYICASRTILQHAPLQQWKESFTNIICLENLEMYPFIKRDWDGTLSDAVAIVAQLFHFRRIVDWTGGSVERRAILDNYGIIYETDVYPPNICLMTQFYKPENRKRYKEIKRCLIKNIRNELIDSIVLLTESDLSAEWGSEHCKGKVNQEIIGKRATYLDFLLYTKNTIPKNTIVIFANADIYFTDTLINILHVDMRDKMYALLRWDEQEDINAEPVLFGPTVKSQDSWIVLSDSIKSRGWDTAVFNYQLGIAGCDNKFATDMMRCRFKIYNPCQSIKSIHVHQSGFRTYSPFNPVPADIYTNIEPSHLGNILHVKEKLFEDKKLTTLIDNPFTVRIQSSSPSNSIVFCTMVGKKGLYNWEADGDNFYTNQIPLYLFKDASVTPNGVVFDLKNMYLGNNEKSSAEIWMQAPIIHAFSKMVYKKNMIAIPLKNSAAIFQNVDTYCLNYLSRALRICREYPGYSFYAPYLFENTINKFKWDMTGTMYAVPWSEDNIVFSDNVIASMPGNNEISMEDINSLRMMYPTWKKMPDTAPKKCVIQYSSEQDCIMSQGFSKKLGELLGNDWNIILLEETMTGENGAYDEMTGASLYILFNKPDSSYWNKIWALPEHAVVLEFQNELAVDGSMQHVTAAAKLNAWIFLLHKALSITVQEDIIKIFQKWQCKHLDVCTKQLPLQDHSHQVVSFSC